MARFTVRIELHEASWNDYEELYETLAAQGFSDIVDFGGTNYKLPPAEYNFDGNATKEQVLDKAKACAAGVVKLFEILVTESNGRISTGLKKA